jgi:hypothetical protein
MTKDADNDKISHHQRHLVRAMSVPSATPTLALPQ